jgi:hypothetical protein
MEDESGWSVAVGKSRGEAALRRVVSRFLLYLVFLLSFGFMSRLEGEQINAAFTLKNTVIRQADDSAKDRDWVEFAPGVDWPQVLLRPRSGTWDWSKATILVVPVENPTPEPIELLVRIDDDLYAGGTEHTMGSLATIAPKAAVDLLVPLHPFESLSLGMRVGPPPVVDYGNESMAELARRQVAESVHGKIDQKHVAAVHLSLRKGDRVRTLVFGNLRTEFRLLGEERVENLVDGFGQFAHSSWPEKVVSVDDLKYREELENQELERWEANGPALDRFGGLLNGPKFKATGFFRSEKKTGRWWLVTPEGHGFFSLGVDTVMVADGCTYIQGREKMFKELPADDDPLSVHFGTNDSQKLAVMQRGRAISYGRYFNFYTANLERKYGADYLSAWRDNTIRRLKAWGFNTLGAWTEDELCGQRRLPYTIKLTISGDFARVSSGTDHWGKMADPFDPRFAAAVDSIISKQTTSLKEDPNLIGYFVDNELSWGGDDSSDPRKRYGLAVNTLAAGSESPAKAAFVKQLRSKYQTPKRLAKSWGIKLASWNELDAGNFKLPIFFNKALIRDLGEFTSRYTNKYFRTIAEALKKNDPNHLYLGCRFAAKTKEAVAAAGRWCDVVSFNVYNSKISAAEKNEFKVLGKPVIIGEFHFGSRDRGAFWGGMVDVGEENKRGPAYAKYVAEVVADGSIVGCHWFQYVDQPVTGRLFDGENGHVGLVTVADVPYHPFVDTVRAANLKLLEELSRSSN